MARHNLNKKCSKKDKVRSITPDVLRKENPKRQPQAMSNIAVTSHEHQDDSECSQESDVEECDEDCEDIDNDLVLNDLDAVEDWDDGLQDEEFNTDNGLVQTTWYDRLVGSWKLASI